jgi:PAS domain S-box-containing protein
VSTEVFALLEGLSDAFLIIDQEWQITYANSVALAPIGAAAKDVVGHNLWERFPVLEGSPTGAAYRRAMAERVPVQIEDRGAFSGSWYEVIVHPWTEGIAVYARDISKRKRAEDALRRSEERYRALARASNQAIWSWDPETGTGKFDETQRWWEEITGQSPAEQAGVGWLALVHADDRERAHASWSTSMTTGAVYDSEYRIRSLAGGFRYIRATGVPVLEPDGRVREWVGALADVTPAREAERELKEANRRKDNFLAMLAHELRNPLAPIRNAAEVLKIAGPDPVRIEKARSMIDRQVAHMARLIDDLLDVSRISQGKILIRREPVDLAALVRSTAEDHRALLEGAGLALLLEVPDRPLWMDGDPTRLSQALGNLLQNAIKFTNPEGRVTVRLTESGGAAELRVEDTGVGMDPEILARLFQPFSQADQTLDRSRGGLGLGLSLVKGLVEMHGGSVQADSSGGGRGSALTLRLPLQAREPAPAPGETATTPEAKTLRVLIIEDNQDAADSLQILLELSGHRAEVAYTGKDGLDASRRQPPQVVLCDIGLPGGMNGYDVARGLRAELPEIQLIALTGYGQEEDQRRALEAGFDRHLTKPVDPAALIRLLGEMSQA